MEFIGGTPSLRHLVGLGYASPESRVSTITQDLDLEYGRKALALGVDATGRWVALGGSVIMMLSSDSF
jgi:hypothetical protein